MLVMWAAEDPTDPLGEFVSAQETLRLYHFALAVYPLGLYGIQPWTLLWQQAAHDSHSFAALFDTAVVRTEPTPEHFGDMPACVVPDQKQKPLANCSVHRLLSWPNSLGERWSNSRNRSAPIEGGAGSIGT
jgi:hypothetical protein